MIRNIIFDWSGTLVDDLPAVWLATNHVFVRGGLREMPLEEFRREFCLPFENFYQRHAKGIPLTQLEQWYHEIFPQVQDSIEPLPHAREFLDDCRSRGCRLFLLSSIHSFHYPRQAARTGFGDFFERAYIQVMDKRDKICELLGENSLNPKETMFVGDMPHDVETAKHGKVWSCAVLTGFTPQEQLQMSNPDLLVEHLGELRNRLDQGWPQDAVATVTQARSI
ncbi:MAG: HAD family hydrolase [Pedosphaera sp.]|nr:HAD family hydrolase [Pedosphaera sp.]